MLKNKLHFNSTIKYGLTLGLSLLFLSSIDIHSKAQAGTCTFGSVVAGELVKSSSRAAMEGSAGVTGFSSGAAGRVLVDCSNGGSLAAAAPNPISVPATFSPAVRQTIVQLGNTTGPSSFIGANVGGTFDSGAWNITNPTMILPTGSSSLNIAMIAGSNLLGSVPSGTYRYVVQLTVTPN